MFQNLSYALILCTLLCTVIQAQTPSYSEESDPEAKKILQQLKSVYDHQEGAYIKYDLILSFGEDTERQSGEIYQRDDRFHIKNNDNVIVNDGQTIWFYSAKQNEVQINDVDPDESGFMSPSSLLNIYNAEDDYFFAITDKSTSDYKIEFKPRDDDSEIMKARIELQRNPLTMKSLIVFSTDGARYTFVIKSFTKKTLGPTYFQFDKSQYSGLKVVDLRE